MARPGLTQEDVFAAAATLEEEGTPPTVNLLREH